MKERMNGAASRPQLSAAAPLPPAAAPRRPTWTPARTLAQPAPQRAHHRPQGQAAHAASADMSVERGSCYGCGAPLQLSDSEAPGYVERERYEIKRRHRQLDQLLCGRCQELSNGAMIPAVADFAQLHASSAAPTSDEGAGLGFAGKRLLAPEALRAQLAAVREKAALVVLLVDLLDTSGTVLGRVRELVGANPILLIGTKADLLPAGTDLEAVADWLAGAAAFKRISVAGVHLVSSRSGEGVAAAAAALRRERAGRDVYVLGAANVGKSAFIRALVKEMGRMTSRQYDAAAAQRGRYLPVESAMPGTTLRLIPMEVFGAGGVLYDTPGLHLHHRVPHLLSPDDNKLLHPRRRLRAYVAPSPADLAAASSGAHGGGPARATYWWGGLARIDVVDCPDSTQLVFYGPPPLVVAARGPAGAPGSAQQPGRDAGPPHAGSASGRSAASSGDAAGQHDGAAPAPFGAASVAARGGLRLCKQLVFRAGGSTRRPLGDVAVSGVPGWVAVYAAGRPPAGEVRLEVWAPVGVEVFARPPLPVPPPFE